MVPPSFLTADAADVPNFPSSAGSLAAWLEEVFHEALFVTQEGRVLRFARVQQRAADGAALVISTEREPGAEADVLVPLAALKDKTVFPCIATVFLSIFNTPIAGTTGTLTAKKSKADAGTIKQIVVTRGPAAGETGSRTQSTLTVKSFLSQVTAQLRPVRLTMSAAARATGAAQHPAAPAENTVSWARLPKLVDLARTAEALPAMESSMSLSDAEELLSAALGRPVAGKAAILNAAVKLNDKLSARTAVRTAIACALDVARESSIELTMRDKGEILAAHGIPSAKASPAGRPTTTTARPAARPAAQQQAPQAAAESAGEDGGEDDESSGGSESYEDDSASDAEGHHDAGRQGGDETGQPGDEERRRKRKRTRHSHDSPRRPKKKSSSARSAPDFSPGADLARLTPAGMSAAQVARVLFGHPVLSDAAKYTAPPPEAEEEEPEAVAQRRTAYAVRRLTEACGTEWLPARTVASKTELCQVREHAAHVIARQTSGAPVVRRPTRPPTTGAASSSAAHHVLIDVDPDAVAVAPVAATMPAGASALASEHKHGALLPDVVQRLHAGCTRVAFEQGDDVGAGIRSAPEHLRADLARAIGSNGRVDAPGEIQTARCTVPWVVVRMSSTLVDEVVTTLRQLPAEDESGNQFMYTRAARKLAEAAVQGHFQVSDYAKEVAHILGPRNAPKSGSLDQTRHVWRYMREALLTTASALYALRNSDAGLKRVDNRIGATAGSIHIDASSLQTWLRRILDSWENAVASFRKGAPQVPSFTECVREHEDYFRFTSIAASLEERASAGQHSNSRRDSRRSSGSRDQRGAQGSRSPTRDDADSGGESQHARSAKRSAQGVSRQGKKRERGRRGGRDDSPSSSRPAGQAQNTDASAWPNKPRMSKEQFDAFKSEVREKCKDTCNFFLISSCRSGNCKWDHKIPDAFLAIKEKYAAA